MPSNFTLYSPISGTLCWLYIPHLADSYLYMHAKRPCGYACKKQVKILLCYYVIVERNTANTPFQVDTSVYRVFTGAPLVP